jgi:hypothetical protein
MHNHHVAILCVGLMFAGGSHDQAHEAAAFPAGSLCVYAACHPWDAVGGTVLMGRASESHNAPEPTCV